MKWWTPAAVRFWLKAGPSLGILLLAGAFLHVPIRPAHIHPTDYPIAIPVILCIAISIRADIIKSLSRGGSQPAIASLYR